MSRGVLLKPPLLGRFGHRNGSGSGRLAGAVVVVMTVHKLSAGDGYTYLTRQVASADERRPDGQSLAGYYAAQGNPPGVWLGRGAEVLGVAGNEVSETQMKALFGAGRHPNAEAMLRSGASDASTRLGAAYPDLLRAGTSGGTGGTADRRVHRRAPKSSTEPEQRVLAAREGRRDRRAVAGFDLEGFTR